MRREECGQNIGIICKDNIVDCMIWGKDKSSDVLKVNYFCVEAEWGLLDATMRSLVEGYEYLVLW